MAEYRPEPIDTSAVKLPASLQQLLEKLAANTHEVWAAQRISQGWTLGPTRNDAKKQHPSLIPYVELSEEEKQYDRQTAGETLKVVLSLGYTIHEPIRANFAG
jgi:RyR domain